MVVVFVAGMCELQPHLREVLDQSKVGQLDVTVEIEQQVVRLDVAMDVRQPVERIDRLDRLTRRARWEEAR